MELLLSTLTILSLLLLLLPSPASSNESNILATGDTLPTDGQLSYGGAVFVIQDDCNLVLYNQANGFQSNTHGFGTNCTLTLSDLGELLIKSPSSGQIWSSAGGAKRGNYAAVLGPDGRVNVFGPSVWSTPKPRSSSESADAVELDVIPPVRNLLFSSQAIYGGSALTSRDYKLEMTADCSLEFSKASEGVVWESGTKGKGKHCFLRLNHRGQLAVVGDNYRVLWASKLPPAPAEGDYVLVVEIHGQAAVYGPVVWSSGS